MCALRRAAAAIAPPIEGWGRGRRPVMNVSWEDARSYVRWLSRKTGKRYRLLSEAEWEYAARAGTTEPFHTGSTISTDQANYNGDYIYGSGRKGVDRGRTVPVGSFPSNSFGLHDVHGNVSEWIEDCVHGNYSGAPSDGTAWPAGGECGKRVLRGGSWDYVPRYLRSAFRDWNSAGVPERQLRVPCCPDAHPLILYLITSGVQGQSPWSQFPGRLDNCKRAEGCGRSRMGRATIRVGFREPRFARIAEREGA